ncbi:MAG: hypothetical protein ACK5QX_10425, partial [bacterium]
MSVGAVRCQSGRVASHVRGMWAALRGSGLQIVALAMRHNVWRLGEGCLTDAQFSHKIYGSFCQTAVMC